MIFSLFSSKFFPIFTKLLRWYASPCWASLHALWRSTFLKRLSAVACCTLQTFNLFNFPVQVPDPLSVWLPVAIPQADCHQFSFQLGLFLFAIDVLWIIELMFLEISFFIIWFKALFYRRFQRNWWFLAIFIFFIRFWACRDQYSLFSMILWNLVIIFRQMLCNFRDKFLKWFMLLAGLRLRNINRHFALKQIDSIPKHLGRELLVKICIYTLWILGSCVIWNVLSTIWLR